MTKRQRTAMVKAMAAEVKKYIDNGGENIGISALNYGLKPDEQTAKELRALLPDIEVAEGFGFMGYMHFTKKAQAVRS